MRSSPGTPSSTLSHKALMGRRSRQKPQPAKAQRTNGILLRCKAQHAVMAVPKREPLFMQLHLSKEIAALLQSLTVLVVEDNAFTRKVNRQLLLQLGVKTVHEAVDGVTGLEAIRRYDPDLVIVDWSLPLLTGAEL